MISKRFVKKLATKAIAFGLSVALAFSVFPNFNAIANAAGGELTLQRPILIVTGDGLYTEAGATTKEKSYTMSDLEKISDVNGEYYSASKSKETKSKSYFIADGVKVSTLIGDSIDSVEFISISGYGKDKPFKLTDKRYFYNYTGYKNDNGTQKYFKDQITNGEYTSKEVPTIITWANAYTFNENKYPEKNEANYPNELPIIDNIAEQGYLRTMCGQTSPTDANQSKFNGNIDDPLNKILVGKEIETTVLTVNEDEFTRAQLLMIDFAEREYSKDQLVRGIPLAVLLRDIEDDYVVEFQCADGQVAKDSTMTVKALKEGNFMLGYEVNGNPICDSSNNKCGYLTLYGDESKPVNMINKITTAKADQAPVIDDDENPDDTDKPEANDIDANDKDNNDNAVKSGDESNMIPFMVLLITALIGAAGTVLYRRRSN